MNALVSSMEQNNRFAPNLDNVATGELFNGWSSSPSWQTCPRSMNFVIVYLYKGAVQATTNRASTYEEAVRKAKAVLAAYNYDQHQWKAQIWSRELYNHVIVYLRRCGGAQHLSNELFQEYINQMAGSHQNQQALPNRFKNIGVHVLWNMTGACYVNAFETMDEAVKAAEDLAAQYPLNKYLICSPASVVYQPRNIKVEAYSAAPSETPQQTNVVDPRTTALGPSWERA